MALAIVVYTVIPLWYMLQFWSLALTRTLAVSMYFSLGHKVCLCLSWFLLECISDSAWGYSVMVMSSGLIYQVIMCLLMLLALYL